MTTMTKHKPIWQYAKIIAETWKNPYYAAVPYIRAMREIDQIGDMYYHDSAKSVVLYFLSNATGWKGDTARAVKKELREICKIKVR